LGWDSGWEAGYSSYSRESVATPSAQKEEEELGIIKAAMGEKVTLKSGLALVVTSADIDLSYEKESKTKRTTIRGPLLNLLT
jgi:hypothetical protein